MSPRSAVYLVGLLGALGVQAWLPGQNEKQLHAFDQGVRSAKFDKRYLYSSGPLRGVNLGSQFIAEPWMLGDTWTNDMGCGSSCSEFDCVLALGQDTANTNFQNHWNTWITPDDISTMQSYGLNTIRIPLGYWILESLVDSSEHFPQGALPYLDALVGKASDLGMYVILDFHGAPYAQDPQQPFTGQCSSSAGFYQDSQYERAYTWLQWMTNRTHSMTEYRNVGMLEILNEPLAFGNVIQSEADTMTQTYYPTAISKIRDIENGLGISDNNQLTVIMMDSQWGAGDPKSSLNGAANVGFDDHEYINGANPGSDQNAYMSYACNDNRDTDGDDPKVVGEFSLAIAQQYQSDSDFDPTTNQDWYKNYFIAQIQNYERNPILGWVFWSWKVTFSSGGDYRWDYNAAVQNGIIPNSGDGLTAAVQSSVC